MKEEKKHQPASGGSVVQEKDFKYVRLSLHEDLIKDFNQLYKKFVIESAVFDLDTSRVLFMCNCVEFLTAYFKSEKLYYKRTPSFEKLVTRGGWRPKSDRFPPDDYLKTLYFRLDEYVFLDYLNLMYSYVKSIDETKNKFYSVSYFFTDFVELLKDNFEGLCKYYKK